MLHWRSAATALELGLVGPTARGSGIAIDVRTSGYGGHDELPVTPITAAGGDALARVIVCWTEISQAIALCRGALDRLLDAPGPLAAHVPDRLRGEGVSRVEAPRGELFYYVAADGERSPARVRVHGVALRLERAVRERVVEPDAGAFRHDARAVGVSERLRR